jgi:hypothetical protein
LLGLRLGAEMSAVKDEIEAFQKMQSKLEAEHMGQWVLMYQRKLINVYDAFEVAADDAVRRFGSGPFLIRQIGAPPITLPASVMYHRPDANR